MIRLLIAAVATPTGLLLTGCGGNDVTVDKPAADNLLELCYVSGAVVSDVDDADDPEDVAWQRDLSADFLDDVRAACEDLEDAGAHLDLG
jgi:hypothetical protein